MSALFILGLLFVVAGGLPSQAEAAALPLAYGATWEYGEFTDAFRSFLYSRNPLSVYLFITIALVLEALLIRELFRYRRGYEIKAESRSSAGAEPGDNNNKPIQRRAWARVESCLDCHFIISQETDEDTETKPHSKASTLKGLIVDLSGGGCKIATPIELQVGDELELFLDLGGRRRLTLKCQVVRVERDTESDQTFAGIMFKDITEAIRDQIISWTFKHQQSILEGQRRIAEGRCVRCGKPLTEVMRQESVFCPKCDRAQKDSYRRYSISQFLKKGGPLIFSALG